MCRIVDEQAEALTADVSSNDADRERFFRQLREMAERANLTPEEADRLAEEAVQAARRSQQPT